VLEDRPLLIWVLEQGGYPDFTTLYQALGYRVEKAQGVRKALKLLKHLEPQVVVAEFNYVPTYGARISPVEPLLARVQSHHPMTRVLLFTEQDRLAHLATLRQAYPGISALSYPVAVGDLQHWLSRK
jgi:hypothetical protein